MLILNPAIKQDPVRRWNLKDRSFFAHGACHILAHAFLVRFNESGFRPFLILPEGDYRGSHIFVSNGVVSFDYRGYVKKDRMIAYHQAEWRKIYSTWSAKVVLVEKSLISNSEMRSLGVNMREPEYFLKNPIPRAIKFLDRFNHSLQLSV